MWIALVSLRINALSCATHFLYCIFPRLIIPIHWFFTIVFFSRRSHSCGFVRCEFLFIFLLMHVVQVDCDAREHRSQVSWFSECERYQVLTTMSSLHSLFGNEITHFSNHSGSRHHFTIHFFTHFKRATKSQTISNILNHDFAHIVLCTEGSLMAITRNSINNKWVDKDDLNLMNSSDLLFRYSKLIYVHFLIECVIAEDFYARTPHSVRLTSHRHICICRSSQTPVHCDSSKYRNTRNISIK